MFSEKQDNIFLTLKGGLSEQQARFSQSRLRSIGRHGFNREVYPAAG
jgi:hypothetical protein